MKLGISGIGVWSRGFRNWDEFQTVCTTLTAEQADWHRPAPGQIPGRERRRAPELVKLAVEVAHQACDMSVARKSEVASVFCSAMGDSEIAAYVCETLAGPVKALSPTKFHNSVHNAPAGYWSISTTNRAPSSSVAGSRNSFPVALLEASSLVAVERRPVVLVAADIEVRGAYEDVYPIQNPFGTAILIEYPSADSIGRAISLEYRSGSAPWPTLENPFLQELSETNPAARCLGLIEALASHDATAIQLPVNDFGHLNVQVSASDSPWG